MSVNSYVRARIEPQLKDKVSFILSEMGLTVSEAIRLFLVRVASEKAIPFDVKAPNEDKIWDSVGEPLNANDWKKLAELKL